MARAAVSDMILRDVADAGRCLEKHQHVFIFLFAFRSSFQVAAFHYPVPSFLNIGSAIMSAVFKLGQVLKGRLSTYTITKEVQKTVWFAK